MTEQQTTKQEVVYVTPDQEEEIGMKEELKQITEQYDTTSYYEWVKGPHSVLCMVALLGVLIYLYYKGYITSPPSNLVPWLFVSLVVVCWCTFFLPDSYFVHPHPMFWKFIQGVGLCYLMLICFLLFQNVNDVRQWLKNIDPKLGVPLPEREYAIDCRLYTPELPCKWNNFKNVLFDEFVIYHFVGWWARCVICRDWKLTWFNSILFEFMELSFQHILPNFHECWWDHIILDVFGCNALGIWLGSKTLQYFELREYNFSGVSPMQKKGKIFRVIGQFTPTSWTRYHWGMFTHWKRFIYVIILIIYFQLFDLNSFFLKAELWLKPSHYLNLIRLIVLALQAPLVFRQCYQYVIDKNTKDIGSASWILGLTLLLEGILCFKWGYPEYKSIPTPFLVKWGWIITISFVVIFGIIFFTYKEIHYSVVRSKTPSVPLEEDKEEKTKTD
ncbi:phosphatidylserine synthase, putative [Entamoeba histolytica HM-1:IMSS-B]|uniref:Phosphatidylserine synthase, putative n=6 Tax=Entamoeba histolytica TaxID=5759 RepID=C4M0P6_ENTH1|nr:phosphatidylserine synthase, putative [Entamoeba histolytica HM-1:IMSS]EMD48839.1 phosphatidylserine synthase, putative [Entamoeba histolytica KU27]EMH78089.1 phosphatidylserine synthase, putative [Entamoeba histolytica HM-1:IMSS-B]EMS14952.1 phosphatidylserine synthase [Entamoeba histolytica HM-3:IMSS]ENY60449.1 phosphatidylserine synthase, putative [Entamoeba histolytica HM-1:IMSS-A]GAT94744.1 phosphatidylserine synthase putative [Entamoeba histolytica]|eukprot:XP_657102.1 phosphatidylserine synthase, putative [Entamoeba histolytica HM-1:IMSS]